LANACAPRKRSTSIGGDSKPKKSKKMQKKLILHTKSRVIVLPLFLKTPLLLLLNIRKILLGFLNLIWKDWAIEALAKKRIAMCKQCPFIKTDASINRCGSCGCVIEAKARSPKSLCPEQKWEQIGLEVLSQGNKLYILSGDPNVVVKLVEGKPPTQNFFIEGITVLAESPLFQVEYQGKVYSYKGDIEKFLISLLEENKVELKKTTAPSLVAT
jgi:hypothetical protein